MIGLMLRERTTVLYEAMINDRALFEQSDTMLSRDYRGLTKKCLSVFFRVLLWPVLSSFLDLY